MYKCVINELPDLFTKTLHQVMGIEGHVPVKLQLFLWRRFLETLHHCFGTFNIALYSPHLCLASPEHLFQ